MQAPALLGFSSIRLFDVEEVQLSSLRRTDELVITAEGELDLELPATAVLEFVRIEAENASGCGRRLRDLSRHDRGAGGIARPRPGPASSGAHSPLVRRR